MFTRGSEKYHGKLPIISNTLLPYFSLSFTFFFNTMFSSLNRATLFTFFSCSNTYKEVFKQESSFSVIVITMSFYFPSSN